MAKVNTKTNRKKLTDDTRKLSSGKKKKAVETAAGAKRKTRKTSAEASVSKTVSKAASKARPKAASKAVSKAASKAVPVKAAEVKRKPKKTSAVRKKTAVKPAAPVKVKAAESVRKKHSAPGKKPERAFTAAKPEKVSAKQKTPAEKKPRSGAGTVSPKKLEEPEVLGKTDEETLYYLPDLPEKSDDVPNPDYEVDDTPVGKTDSLKRYIQNISSYPRITVEDEVRLAEMIHSTDDDLKAAAIDTLINANLRLVVKIAHDFKGIGLPLLDLISEGNIGLMRSVRKFNPALGAKFSSYAAWWIKQSMHRALSNQTRLIRIPVQSGSKMRKIRKMRDALKLDLGRDPEISEIARALNYSERTVSTLCHAENSVFSLNDPIKSDENDTFEELIADPNAKSPETLAGDRDSLSRVREALKLLDQRERQVISLRFFQGKTLEEVSVLIKRTRERVRQIQNQALSKMRAVLVDEAAVVNS